MTVCVCVLHKKKNKKTHTRITFTQSVRPINMCDESLRFSDTRDKGPYIVRRTNVKD